MILNLRQSADQEEPGQEIIGAPERVTCLIYRDDVLHHKYIGPETELRMHLRALLGHDPFAQWRYEVAK